MIEDRGEGRRPPRWSDRLILGMFWLLTLNIVFFPLKLLSTGQATPLTLLFSLFACTTMGLFLHTQGAVIGLRRGLVAERTSRTRMGAWVWVAQVPFFVVWELLPIADTPWRDSPESAVTEMIERLPLRGRSSHGNH